MEDKPYYEQEYHEPKTDIPRPTFGQAFKLLFTAPFKQNARSTRRGFWYAYVWAIILLVILAACSATAYSIDGIAYSSNEFFLLTHVSTGTLIIQIIIYLLIFWILLGLLGFTIRRLHDTDHTGWWYWISVIPFGYLFLLYFMVLPTVEKPVRWGSYLFKEKK